MKLARKGWHHRCWYWDAGWDIKGVGRLRAWNHEKLADVLALTSPRMAVTRNIRVTLLYMRDGWDGLPNDVTRTVRSALRHWEETGEIRGPKTSAFAACLKGDMEQVVLDTWMARALAVPQRVFGTKRGYASGARRIRYGAHLVGITPAEFQAAVWAATVKRAGRNVPSLLVSRELANI
jgi:hypothetical protein